MDIEGLQRVLTGIEQGTIRVVSRDLTEPSPLALEVLSARPYAFLDDAPLEERRTQAVMARRWLDPESAADIGRLDPEAIERVRAEAWPEATNRDELHDALAWFGFATEAEVRAASGWNDWLAELAAERRTARLHLPAGTVWIAAERLPAFRALWPDAKLDPAITAPAEQSAREWSPEEALVEIVRGRLEGQGPVSEHALAAPLGVEASQVAAALIALEAEGFAMRGRFTPGANDEEWCERRLLARIHGYTIKRLRAEIEPVAARDFLRFLFSWQHVTDDARMEGPDALDEVVGQLEGFGAPAGAWETEILPARLAGYEPAWLDDRCLAGRVTWSRLGPRSGRPTNGDRRAAPVRTTPITLLVRQNAALWASLNTRSDTTEPSPRAQQVVDFLRQHGASFFDEMAGGSGLLRSQLEEALAELVALGMVTSDSFGGLRALLVPSDRRQSLTGARRRRRTASFGMDGAGRWALVRRAPLTQPGVASDPQAVEHLARTLLRRYGVVFWRLLEREAPWLPPWRDLLRVYRTLERRGEIRGGRFVAGFSGEQYALPEAVGALREARRKAPGDTLVSLSGADPLNLAGILTPGAKVAALTGNRVLYRDGLPVALLAAGEVQFLETLEPATEWQARIALLRSAMPTELAHQVS
jgi:ATP-dependent Lhr-like helicase